MWMSRNFSGESATFKGVMMTIFYAVFPSSVASSWNRYCRREKWRIPVVVVVFLCAVFFSFRWTSREHLYGLSVPRLFWRHKLDTAVEKTTQGSFFLPVTSPFTSTRTPACYRDRSGNKGESHCKNGHGSSAPGNWQLVISAIPPDPFVVNLDSAVRRTAYRTIGFHP